MGAVMPKLSLGPDMENRSPNELYIYTPKMITNWKFKHFFFIFPSMNDFGNLWKKPYLLTFVLGGYFLPKCRYIYTNCRTPCSLLKILLTEKIVVIIKLKNIWHYFNSITFWKTWIKNSYLSNFYFSNVLWMTERF